MRLYILTQDMVSAQYLWDWFGTYPSYDGYGKMAWEGVHSTDDLRYSTYDKKGDDSVKLTVETHEAAVINYIKNWCKENMDGGTLEAKLTEDDFRTLKYGAHVSYSEEAIEAAYEDYLSDPEYKEARKEKSRKENKERNRRYILFVVVSAVTSFLTNIIIHMAGF